MRKLAFEKSKKEIEDLKRRDKSCGVMYNVSLNEFSDWTDEELKGLSGTKILPMDEDTESDLYDFENDRPILDRVKSDHHPKVQAWWQFWKWGPKMVKNFAD